MSLPDKVEDKAARIAIVGRGRTKNISKACSGGFHARCFWNERNECDCECHTEYIEDEEDEES